MPRGELSADEIERLTNASDTIREMPLIIEETASPTISRIKATATRVARELEAKGQRLGCIGIDYLGLLASSDRYRGNKVAETEEITTGLKAMAKELDTAVVVLSQLSRNVERQENKRPCLADLRWSGSIEQDADVVMFLFREHYYLAQDRSGTADEQLERQDQARAVANQLEISVAKNRGGMLGRVELFCDIGCNVIRDFGGQP